MGGTGEQGAFRRHTDVQLELGPSREELARNEELGGREEEQGPTGRGHRCPVDNGPGRVKPNTLRGQAGSVGGTVEMGRGAH